ADGPGIAPCAFRTGSGAGHPCSAGPRTRASHPRPGDADAIPLRKPVRIRGHPVLRRRHPSAGVGGRDAAWPPSPWPVPEASTGQRDGATKDHGAPAFAVAAEAAPTGADQEHQLASRRLRSPEVRGNAHDGVRRRRSRLKPLLRGPTRSIGSPRDGCAVRRFEGTRTRRPASSVAAEAAPTGGTVGTAATKKRAGARSSVALPRVRTAYSSETPSPSSTAFIDRRMRPCLSTSSTLTLTTSPSRRLSETFSTRSFEICDTCTRPSLPGRIVTNAPKSMILTTLPS